tara:strand:- start:184 stop:708 length:525 start_codon:yes stop_codon:yes gene_type:complete
MVKLVPFQYICENKKIWNDEKHLYENDDEFSSNRIIDFSYNFYDHITDMIEGIEKNGEPNISDLIKNYIWNDICREDIQLLKIFHILYGETDFISFTFYRSNHSCSKFNEFACFRLENNMTDEYNYFIIKDRGISTSSQKSLWIGEFHEEFEEQNGYYESDEEDEVVIDRTADG